MGHLLGALMGGPPGNPLNSGLKDLLWKHLNTTMRGHLLGMYVSTAVNIRPPGKEPNAFGSAQLRENVPNQTLECEGHAIFPTINS